MKDPARKAQLDELARVALADKPDVILHALEVSCGAVGIGATSEELAEAMSRGASNVSGGSGPRDSLGAPPSWDHDPRATSGPLPSQDGNGGSSP